MLCSLSKLLYRVNGLHDHVYAKTPFYVGGVVTVTERNVIVSVLGRKAINNF